MFNPILKIQVWWLPTFWKSSGNFQLELGQRLSIQSTAVRAGRRQIERKVNMTNHIHTRKASAESWGSTLNETTGHPFFTQWSSLSRKLLLIMTYVYRLLFRPCESLSNDEGPFLQGEFIMIFFLSCKMEKNSPWQKKLDINYSRPFRYEYITYRIFM